MSCTNQKLPSVCLIFSGVSLCLVFLNGFLISYGPPEQDHWLSLSLYSLSLSLYGKCPFDQKKRKMKKGVHPQMEWISYVTQSGRLIHVMMTKMHQAGKVYHVRARRQMAERMGQIAKFKKRYEKQNTEETEANKD